MLPPSPTPRRGSYANCWCDKEKRVRGSAEQRHGQRDSETDLGEGTSREWVILCDSDGEF